MAKVFLITGSSKGIGKYLVEYYLKKGHQVIGCSRSELNIESSNYRHFCLDVSDETNVKSCLSEIRKSYGQLDVLINNAGIASMNHTMLTPKATVEKIFNTNYMGTFLFCREAAKLMQIKKSGNIVNFSTVAVPLNLEGEAAYASSKAAIVSLTKILAKEFSKLGIRVNAIGPTPIETDLIRSVPKAKIDNLLKQQAIERLGIFPDVSNVIDFYLQESSDFITGQTIYLGGVS